MAEAGRSLKPFYLLLGAIAVVGAVLIAVLAGGPAMPDVASTSDCEAPAPGAPSPKGVVLGPDSAKVEITEFADFECPWCARFAILTEPDVRQRLISTGKVRWRYMNFPLPPEEHPNTAAAHLVAACALEQGKFWEMHDMLYMNQSEWASEKNPMKLFLQYATRLGLNTDSLRACVVAKRPWPEIQAEKCEGIRLGVPGTPSFFVNGHKLPDNTIPAYDDLAHIVDSVTAATAAHPAAARTR
jgi:protein-disulfide isomerase